jgi:hypothetical protein
MTTQLRYRALLAFIGMLCLTCIGCSNSGSSGPTPNVDAQGIFDFPSDLIEAGEDRIPAYLDEDKILCRGKGLKVARCISNQLKNGICLGIIKDQKKVYAVEIPCDSVKEAEVDSVEVSSM